MDTTRELAPEAWAEYLDAVNKELVNAPVSIEIVAAPDAPTVEAAGVALHEITYDQQDGVFEIAATRGGPDRPSKLRHTVEHPARIEVDSHTMLAPMRIAVEAPDGVRTVITIEHEAALTG